MKKFFISFILLSFFIISCEKGTNQSELTKIKKETYPAIESEIDLGEPIASNKEVNQAYREIFKAISPSNARSNEEKWPFGIVQMNKEDVVVIDDREKGLKSYTFKLLTKNPKKKFFYNAIIAEYDSGEFSEPQLLRYDLSSEFEGKYYGRRKSFGYFQGTMKRFSLKNIDLFGGGRNSMPCEEVYFAGGGGGSYNFPSSNEGTVTSGGGGGGGVSCDFSIGEIGCPCAGHGVGDNCNCSTQPVVVITISCPDGQQLTNQSSSSRSSNSDCDQVAYDFGINYPQDNDPSDAFSNLNESEYYFLGSNGLTIEQIALVNSLYPVLVDEFSSESWVWPINSEEWKDLSTLILYELQDMKGWIDVIIPLSDIESALKKFQNKSYWGAAFDVSMAAVSFLPVSKAGKLTRLIGKKLTRSTAIIKIFRTVSGLGNSKVFSGFKKTLLNQYKNPHIFKVTDGHLGNIDFEYVLNKTGGQQEMIAAVYREAYQKGFLANIPFSGVKESTINLFGKNIRFKAKNLTENGINQIRIDDFWVP